MFFSSGMKEVDQTVLQHLSALAGSDVIPRVLPSCKVFTSGALKHFVFVNDAHSYFR